MDLLTADAEGKDLDPDDVGLPRHLLAAPERAQACLVLARWHRRHDRLTAASAVLREAQLLLRDWPGRLLDLVTEEIALTHPPVEATEAQRRVLDLLAEGLGNAEIAARLGVAERTVAVHVAAMLRANGARSRTELAARHLRHQLTPG